MFVSAKIIFVLVAAAGVATAGRARGSGWSYSEVDTWADDFPNCGKKQQSPINIKPSQAKPGDVDLIEFNNYDVLPSAQTVTNDGHTIKVDFSSTTEMPSISVGGPWFYQKTKYNFAQYHFHWGSVSSQGSEHTVNSVSFPMELHLVHFNDKYADISEAVSQPDGLAVLGIFFVISRRDNPALTPLLNAIEEVKDYGNDVNYVEKTDLLDLESLLPSNTNRFYRYDGSLTTPTCDESVLWTVFKKPIKISEAQMEVFRSVIGSDGPASDNFRPTQPLNGRKVLKSW